MDDKNQHEQITSQTVEHEAAYVNYYGLAGDPFEPEKPLFFATPQLEKSLRLFNYLARFSRKLVVLTGPAEAGKTALLESFVTAQEGDDRLCSFAALASDSPIQVLLEIAEQLRVPGLTGSENPEQLGEAIRNFSRDCLDEGSHCIVVIDDAELFEPPVLELIYQMASSEPELPCGISFLLSGRPLLFENIEKIVPANMMEKTVFHQQLVAFGFEDVAKYLHYHFIENAGQAKAPFSQNEFKIIFDQSQGLPGRISEAAKQVLLASMDNLLQAEPAARKSTKGFVWALVGLAGVVVAGFLWWQNSDEPTVFDEAERSLVGQIERVDEAAVKLDGESVGQVIFVEPGKAVVNQPSSIEQSAARPAAQENAAEGDETRQASENESEQHTVSDDSEAVVDHSVGEVLNETVSVPVPVPVPVETGEATNTQAPVAKVKAPAVAAHVIAEAQNNKQAEKPVDEKVESQVDAKPVTNPQPESRLTQDTARILAFKPTAFTMQLLGSNQQASVAKVLAKLPNDDRALHFEKTHKGAPWYVLIYGNYPDRAAATAAAADLPRALRSYKPWIRSVSSIHADIKAN